MSLYVKYAPQTFSEMAGKQKLVSLLNVIHTPDHIQCFLFTGGRGMGKTLSARLLAKELNAEIREINASDDRGVDTIRAIIDECQYVQSQNVVYIFDECHQLTVPAREALLKIMQDTPERVYFAFCTTNPEKLNAAFKSRCLTVALTPLDYRDLSKLIRNVARNESIELDPDILDDIIYKAEGSAREALVLLESLRDLTKEEAVTILSTTSGPSPELVELCRCMLKGGGWSNYTSILSTIVDTEPVRQMVLTYMSSVLLKEGSPRISKIIDLFSKPFYDSGKAGLISACYKVCTMGGA